MTTTRPTVNFAVPRENTGGFGLQGSTLTEQEYTYSSIRCENCQSEDTSWNGVALMTVGIVFLAIALLLFARKYIFNIHEISRN